MFKAKELKVKDWCQHKSATVQFVAGTNGIVGTNGKGKSNLVGALFTAITGRVLFDTIEENINFESDKAAIELSFVQDNIDGLVKRGFTGTRIEGNPKNRKAVSPTAKLAYGTLDLSKPAPVNDAMAKITGMNPRVIEDHIFISQDRMQELLFQRKSDRMKNFLTLIPGVERAEPIRNILQQELVNFPELTLASNLEETKQQLADNQIEQQQLHTRTEELKVKLKALDIKQILADETMLSEYNNTEQSLMRITWQANQAAKEANELIIQQATVDAKLAAALAVADSKRATAETARAEVQNYTQNKSVYSTRKKAKDDRDKLMAAIAVIEAPTDGGRPWTELPALKAALSQAQAAVNEHHAVLDKLRLGDDCPTCKRPFENAAEERKKHQTLWSQELAKAQAHQKRIDELEAAERTYNKAVSNYTSWVESAQVRLQSLTDTLTNLPDIPEPDAARHATLTQIIQDYDGAVAAIAPLERESRNTGTLLAQTNSRMETLKEQQFELETKLANKPTSARVQAIKAQHAEHTALTAESSVVDGKLLAKRDEQSRIEQTIMKINMLAEKAKATLEYRALITSVRDVLHRDRLPNEVLGTYVQQLDRLCNKFLDVFGNPFAVCLDREMELECRFPNGYSCNTTRLSGGQKCVLSVAMRFAINELFAKDLGLLILDEPCQWMDDDNIAYMGDLIQDIQKAGAVSGVQTIVITHQQGLIPAFEHVITL